MSSNAYGFYFSTFLLFDILSLCLATQLCSVLMNLILLVASSCITLSVFDQLCFAYLQICTVVIGFGVYPERAEVAEALSGHKRDMSLIEMHRCVRIKEMSKES
jgi:hypothetical protein